MLLKLLQNFITHIKKNTEFNQLMNLALLTSFVVISSVLLYYKYKTRPTEDDRKKIKQLKRDYFVNKVRQLEAKAILKLRVMTTHQQAA